MGRGDDTVFRSRVNSTPDTQTRGGAGHKLQEDDFKMLEGGKTLLLQGVWLPQRHKKLFCKYLTEFVLIQSYSDEGLKERLQLSSVA